STVVTGVPPNLLRWVMPLTLDREQTGHVRPSGYARSAMTEQSTLPSPPAAVPAAPPRTSARSWSPRAARRVLQRAGDLLDDARLLTTAERPLRERVRDAYAATREVRVHADLRAVPVTALEERRRKLRVAVLEKAGFTHVTDVLVTGPDRLVEAGIGATTARLATAAARELADEVDADLRFRIDVDPGDPSATVQIGRAS